MNQPVASGSVKFTAENAPRTVEELALIGRFRLKDLAMSIGLGESQEHRSSLSTMKVDDLAQAIAQQLARLDAAGPTATVAETPAPAPQPEPPQEAPKRTPRTPRVQPPPATPEGTPVAMVDLSPVLNQLTALQEQVAKLQKQLAQHEAISANVAAEAQLQNRLNTSLSLFFAEEELGGSRPEILATALSDMQSINEMVVAATGGKDPKGGK